MNPLTIAGALVVALLTLLSWPWRATRRRQRNDAHGFRQARGYAAADARSTEESEATI